MTEQAEKISPFQDPKTTPQARGKRVETLRRMTRLSRRAFWEKYGVPPSSLQNWEDAKGNGLTEKGARKMIALLKPDGINCSFEWLMYGIGSGPQVSEQLYLDDRDSGLLQSWEAKIVDYETENTLIAKELLTFHHNYEKTAVDYLVVDDGMEPRFMKGDIVAGNKRHRADIEKLIGLDCIIQTIDGDLLLRTLKKTSFDSKYTLACRNPHTTIEKPILYDVEILFAAPVIWVRTKEPK